MAGLEGGWGEVVVPTFPRGGVSRGHSVGFCWTPLFYCGGRAPRGRPGAGWWLVGVPEMLLGMGSYWLRALLGSYWGSREGM